jgi:glucose-6-phosphate 1-dehydrogenase
MTAVDLIIFGASGDLSARKLFPALFQLERLNLLQKDLRIRSLSREPSKHSMSFCPY